MLVKKTKVTINFTTNEITVEALAQLAAQKILVWIVDPLGDTVYKNVNWDTNSDAAFDLQYSTTTSITKDLPVDVNDEILEGEYLIYYKSVSGTSLVSSWDTYIKYCPTIPTISLSLAYTCRTSTITSTDTTDYLLRLSCGATIDPISPSETLYGHTVYYPETIEGTVPDPVTSDDPAEIITITRIYTKRWVSKISRFVSYTIPESLNYTVKTDDTLFSIEGTLLGQTYTDVACSDCICQILTCINQIYNAYKRAVEKDTVRARELQVQLDMLYLLLFRFMLSERCGTDADTAAICAEISAYLDYTGLACCSDSTDEGYSVEVIPYGSSGSSTLTISGTQWYDGASDPSAALGDNGDFFLQTTSRTIWKKTLGTWTSIMTVEFTGEVGNAIIDADFTEETTNTGIYELLKEYTIAETEFNSQTDVVVELTSEIVAEGTESVDDLSIMLLDDYGKGSTVTTTIPIDSSIGAYADTHFTVIRRLYIQYVTSEYVVLYATTTVKSQTGIVLHEFTSPKDAIDTSFVMGIYARSNGTSDITLKASMVEIKRKAE